MSAVLVGNALEGFGRVIGVYLLRGAQQGRAGVDEEVDIALEADAAAEVGAGRQADGAAAGERGRVDGAIDGGAVKFLPIADRAEIADIVDELAASLGDAGARGTLGRRSGRTDTG